MGQCYTVIQKLAIKKGKEKSFVKAYNGAWEWGDCDKPKTFKECVGHLTGVKLDGDPHKDANGATVTDFDARYGWEAQMQEVLEKVARFLEDGSYLTCYPDSGMWTFYVKNGKGFIEQKDHCYSDEDIDEFIEVLNEYGVNNPGDLRWCMDQLNRLNDTMRRHGINTNDENALNERLTELEKLVKDEKK